MEFQLDSPSGAVPALQAADQWDTDTDMGRKVLDLATDHEHLKETDASKTQQYLQAPRISGLKVNDWVSLPDLPARKLGMTQSVSNIYRSSFSILLQAWDCAPADCIPEELRLATPYSLGLVVRLAELALVTRGYKDDAHATLVTVTCERVARTTSPPETVVRTGMPRGVQYKRFLEHRSQERVGGLMIEDVEKAKALCVAASRPSRSAALVDGRADRAARRLNRQRLISPSKETGVQHLDPIDEAHVGDWGFGSLWASLQQKKRHREHEGKPGKARLRREQKRRSEILGLSSRRQDEEANGDKMQEDPAQTQMMDSTRALTSSQYGGQWEDQTPKRSKNVPSAKTHTKRLDKYMARIFKEINVDQDELPDDESRKHGPVLQTENAPQERDGNILPLENSAVWKSPPGQHHQS